MSNKAPGKYYRKGLSLMELYKMFPDDTQAEQWFAEVRWAGWDSLPALRVRQGANRCLPPISALSLSRPSLLQAVQRQDSDRDGRLQSRLPGVGHRHLSDDHQSQERVEHEVAPRLVHHPKECVDAGSQDQEGL